MPVATANDLKETLFDSYDGVADKRVKDLDRDAFFIADDRGDKDYDAKKRLFLWFCTILVKVVDENTVTVILSGGVPVSPNTIGWLEQHGAEETPMGTKFSVSRGNQANLLDLAAAFRAITRPGARYDEKAYKYVCPRTAASIKRLATVLDKAWK